MESVEMNNNTVDEEALYKEAVRICRELGWASPSYLQRRMRIGFNHASRLVDRMEKDGIIGPNEPGKSRVIIDYTK